MYDSRTRIEKNTETVLHMPAALRPNQRYICGPFPGRDDPHRRSTMTQKLETKIKDSRRLRMLFTVAFAAAYIV